MNLPTRAQDAHASLAAAFNTGDVNTVLSMYDFTEVKKQKSTLHIQLFL